MKKSLVLAGLLVASTSVMAMDTQWFAGIGAERTKTAVTLSAGYVSISDDVKDTSAKIKAGAVVNDNHRVSLSYSKIDKDGTLEITLLNYDYLITSENKFTPFIGVHYGIADFDVVDGTLSVDDKGSAYGLQIGGFYNITDNIELEANVAYTTYSVESPIKSSGTAVANTKYELDKTTSLYLGFNYKF